MKIRKHLCFLLLSICLSQTLAMATLAADNQAINTNTANTMASKDDLSSQKEIFQLQLDAKTELLKQQLESESELLKKDIEAQTNRFESFEKRMDDQANRISDIGFWAGILGALITVLLVAIGLLGYKSARSDAKETAKDTASKWFEDNHKMLNSRLDELEKIANLASKNIDDHTENVASKFGQFWEIVEGYEKTLKDQLDDFQHQLSQPRTKEKPDDKSPSDNSAIMQRAGELKQLPESGYTFSDWNTRAFAAFSEKKFEDAIFYLDKAINLSTTPIPAQAQSLHNKATALRKMNRSEEEIAIYDSIISKFGTKNEENLHEYIARAMVNKGYALGELNRTEEAIITYNTVIEKFGPSEDLNTRRLVATAMMNNAVELRRLNRDEEVIKTFYAVITKFGFKYELDLCKISIQATINLGVHLTQLNRTEEAVAAFDSIISKFSGEEELSIREEVALAMRYKGITLGKGNHYKEAIATFDEAIEKFGATEELSLRKEVELSWLCKGFNLLCIAKANWKNETLAKDFLKMAHHACNQCLLMNSDYGLAHGNLAYITWLQGDTVAAEHHFRAGLTSPTDGGDILYKGTLTDFEIYPIAPDQGFRTLVENLWAEYQQAHTG